MAKENLWPDWLNDDFKKTTDEGDFIRKYIYDPEKAKFFPLFICKECSFEMDH